jgi:hypothetical protein
MFIVLVVKWHRNPQKNLVHRILILDDIKKSIRRPGQHDEHFTFLYFSPLFTGFKYRRW